MPGVGHLDIGIGQGDAQVFNPLPAIQQYGQILQQRQAKHDNEVKQLADELARGYDPAGLRNDADRSSYIKQYNDTKDFAINAENQKDPTKKAMQLAQVRQKLNDLGAFSEGSKKQGVFERQIAMQHLSNPNLLDDNSAQQLKTQLQLPWNAENVVKDASGFERRVEPDVIDKAYSAHKDLLTKNLQYDNGTQTPATVAGKKGAYVVQSRGIPMDGDSGAFESTLNWATAKPDVQKSLADRYSNIQGATPQQTLGLRVRQYMTDMGDKDGIYDQTKPVFKESVQPPHFSALQQYNIQHYGNPNSPSMITGNQPTPAQTLAISMQKGVPGSGEKFLELTPHGQYTPGQKPSIWIEPKTGEHKFTFPAQVDQKAIIHNKELTDKYAKEHPGEPYNGKVFGYSKLKDEVKIPAKTYLLNPNSPNYMADFAQMAKEQNVNLSQLNQIEGVKGGHGQINTTKVPQQQYAPEKERGIAGFMKANNLSRADAIKILKENNKL